MLEDARPPLRPLGCLGLRVVYHGHPSPLKGGLRGCWKVGLREAEHGVPSCPRGLPGSTPAQPTLTPQLPPTPEGPLTAIRESGGAESSGPRVLGASTASCVCTPPRLTVQLWGECVHGRDHTDGSRAPPGQEAPEPRGETWAGRLTTSPSVPSAPSAPRITPPQAGL